MNVCFFGLIFDIKCIEHVEPAEIIYSDHTCIVFLQTCSMVFTIRNITFQNFKNNSSF